jgi:hypothetical protein
VQLGAALKSVVLLVDQLRERLLGDRDERHLVRDLEQRELQLLRLRDQRPRQAVVLEPRPQPHPGEAVLREQADELALGLGGLELEAGGEQQLPARQPRRRVLDLGDMHPADLPSGRALAGGELQVQLP